MTKFPKISIYTILSLTSMGTAFARDHDHPDSYNSIEDGANVLPVATAQTAPMNVGISAPETSSETMSTGGGITFFDNQAAFSAAAPGLTLEDFENSSAEPGLDEVCPNPMSTDDAGVCYSAGELEGGFEFSATSGVTVINGPGSNPMNPTTWVVANDFFAHSTFNFFDPEVFAVGYNIFSLFGEPATISVYGSGGVLLGTAIHPAANNFFGVKADQTITRVTVDPGPGPAFDNLQFGKGVIDTDGGGINESDHGIQSSMIWVKDHPVPGFFAFTMTCFLGTLFFIPGIELTLGAGFIFSCAFNLGFGLVSASLSVFLGCSFGAIASFYLGRYLLRSYVESWTQRYHKFEAIDSALSCKGFHMSLLRLSPVIPFNALNYIASITATSFMANTCSLNAILPGTVLYLFLGGTAGTLVEGGGGVMKWVSLGIGILFGILCVVAISFHAKKELRNVMERRMVHCHHKDVEVGGLKGN